MPKQKDDTGALPDRAHWFGTPVGAALLVGALAVGASLSIGSMAQGLLADGTKFWGIVAVQAAALFIHYALLGAAPGVSLRNSQKLFLGVGVGLGCSVLALASRSLIYLLAQMRADWEPLYWVVPFAANMAMDSVLGYSTARLYNLPTLRWRCVAVSLGCCAATLGIWCLRWLCVTAADEVALAVSGSTITSLAQVLPIAFVIERHQARMRRETAVSLDRASVGEKQ